MAKIAVELEQALRRRALSGAPGNTVARRLAEGHGWTVSDVVCTCGPQDRSYEEEHSNVCIAIVAAGSFQYQSSAGRELLTPGSLLLGNAGQCFECSHEHGVGDRCVSFSYEPEYFAELATEAGVKSRSRRFSTLRVPPVRELSSLVARACVGLAECGDTAPGHRHSAFAVERDRTMWAEIGIELAVRAIGLANGGEPNRGSLPAAESRVTRIVRMIEDHPDSDHSLGALAREAKLSRYHFLRTFQQVTGLTPHQYVLRARLRRAATRLILEPRRVLDVALDSGFGDASNFNHDFRAEFGVSPRAFRKKFATQRDGRRRCGARSLSGTPEAESQQLY